MQPPNCIKMAFTIHNDIWDKTAGNPPIRYVPEPVSVFCRHIPGSESNLFFWMVSCDVLAIDSPLYSPFLLLSFVLFFLPAFAKPLIDLCCRSYALAEVDQMPENLCC